MTAHRIEIPAILQPVFMGEADWRWAAGGRGGAKSWAFAKMAAVRGAMWAAEKRSGVILCIRQFMNSLDDSSLQDIKNAIATDAWLSEVYEVGEKFVRTKCGRVRFVFAGTSVNLNSIKSKSKILLCWAEEAETIKDEAWEKIIPTIREEGSECWATWNPESERSWVHRNLRLSKDERVKGTMIGWRDNPWWTDKLERMRAKSEAEDPDNYPHIWEGEFKTVFKGAYYTRDIIRARVEKRIGVVSADPLMQIRAYWDIGGTSARSDACAIWIVQFVGQQINVLNYYEAVGQPISVHVEWLRSNGYGNALCVLPHDGVKHDTVYKVTYESALQDAGFDVEVIPNQGAGAATARIEAARRVFPRIWFDEKPTEVGVQTLQAYRENWDDERNIGLGPLHDFASHCGDAFGLMCVHYEAPRQEREAKRNRRAVSWMG